MSREQEMLGQMRRELTDKELAKIHDLTIEEVRSLRRDFERLKLIETSKTSVAATEGNEPRMSHEARAERREKIAEFVRQGHSKQEAAEEFGVSPETVAAAVKEHGGSVRQIKQCTMSELFGIASRFIARARDADIAREFSLSRERVRQMRLEAETAGVFKTVEELVRIAGQVGGRE